MATARKRRGLTQVQLAEMLGVTQSRIDYYERRAKSPPVDFVADIAAALAVSINHLIADVEEQKPERLHPGPASALEQKIEALRKLSKKEQEVVLRMLDGLLSSSQRRKDSADQDAGADERAE